MTIVQKDCKNKQKINMDNYLTNKKIKRESMKEIDTKICQKKINQG